MASISVVAGGSGDFILMVLSDGDWELPRDTQSEGDGFGGGGGQVWIAVLLYKVVCSIPGSTCLKGS